MMRIIKIILVVVLVTFCLVALAKADSASLSYGKYIHPDLSAEYYRASYQVELSDSLFGPDYTLVEAYLDLAGSVWNHSDEEVLVASVSPVFRIKPQLIESDFKPFIDISAGGPSYISETTFVDRQLDQHFQFENRLGIGVEHGKMAISINAYHYSNAGSGKENEGTDWVVGTFSLEF